MAGLTDSVGLASRLKSGPSNSPRSKKRDISQRVDETPTIKTYVSDRDHSYTPYGDVEYEKSLRMTKLSSHNCHVSIEGAVHVHVRKLRAVDKVEFSVTQNCSEQDIQNIITSLRHSRHGNDEEASSSLVFLPWTPGQHIGQIPLSEQTYNILEDELGIPSVVREILVRTSSMVLEFQSRLKEYGLVLSNHLAHFLDFSLICVYDAARHRTEVYCFNLTRWEIDEIVDRISQSHTTGHHFELMPLLLVDLGTEQLLDFTEQRKAEVRELRRTLGMNTNFVGHAQQTIAHSAAIDLRRVTAQVTSINTSVHSLKARGKGLIMFVDQLRKHLRASDPNEVSRKHESHLDERTRNCYGFKLDYLATVISSNDEELEALHHTLQIQSQTIYSLTAQADNMQNLEVAELSRQIAESTSRDSGDMRVIAAVTLFFLPGTFTATLFSTSFFNFQRDSTADDGSNTVTRWIWLYWVVTACLTALVMLLWWLSSRYRQSNKKKKRTTSEPSKV